MSSLYRFNDDKYFRAVTKFWIFKVMILVNDDNNVDKNIIKDINFEN